MSRVNYCPVWINVCFCLTLEAESPVPVSGVWVTSLVFILVKCADPQLASSTLRPGDGDGVTDTAVR